MTLSITTPPAVEPVTLDELKAHLRVTYDQEDALIGALITAARQRIEAELGLALIATGFRETFDAAPALPDGPFQSLAAAPIVLARGPLTAVQAVAVAAAGGAFDTVPSADYLVGVGSRPGLVTPVIGAWPAPAIPVGGVRIDYTAGFGAAETDVPAPLRQAVLRLAADAFEHRSDPPLATVEPWLAPFRRVRL